MKAWQTELSAIRLTVLLVACRWYSFRIRTNFIAQFCVATLGYSVPKTTILLLLSGLGALGYQPSVYSYDRVTGHDFASRSEVIASQAMAATSQPLATQIALDVMKKGGNAIDAAIAANAALGLMEPTGNGIGGDLYAMVWSARDKKLYGLNGAGRSPKGLSLAPNAGGSEKIGPHRYSALWHAADQCARCCRRLV